MEFPTTYLEKLRKPTTPKGIYSYHQELAQEICQWLGDYKEFGLWVKMAKQDVGKLKEGLKYIKSRSIKSNHYLLKICK